MLVFDKDEIKSKLSTSDIFDLLQEWGGDPQYTSFGILSTTICHNKPGEGSRKLYYYENSQLFRCYTSCGEYFDLLQMVIKIAKIQYGQSYNLNDAVMWVAKKFGLSGRVEESDGLDDIEDWKYFSNYERIQNIELKTNDIQLKEYESDILDRFNYTVKIAPWLKEGIKQEVIERAKIGYYPGGNQITIPHFDINNRLIGIRGRTLSAEEGELYGKYRPLRINKQLYNHPLGMSLYNLNNSKNNIGVMKKAIVYEGEKSALLHQSYFGIENDITVACCGSSISNYQIQSLINVGAEEIIIAFDRQFQAVGDDEFKRLKKNLLNIREKYKNFVKISFIFDKNMITGYKSSPIDEGADKFLKLFNERIYL